MIVHVGSVLEGYTGGRRELRASGRTIAAVLDDLEQRFPGIRFRVVDEQGHIRPHMRVYVGQEPAASLAQRVGEGDVLHVLGALSGG